MAKKHAASGAHAPKKAEAKKKPATTPATRVNGRTDAAHKKAPRPSKGANDVVIRMYKQGLGDCFLLSFPPASGTKPVRVLIDCGVLQRTPDESDKMRAVVDSIRRETDGYVDLLVVTHEHWDHVCGFSHAEDLFKNAVRFGRVWLSWAENPDDPDARAVRADLGKTRAKIQAALGLIERRNVAARLAAADDPSARRMRDDLEATRSVLGFLGPAPLAAAPKTPKPPGVSGMSLGETMDWLRAQVRPGDFCSPGECRPLPGAAGVNVYVLGPPRDVSLIKKTDVSGEDGYKFKADQVSFSGAVEGFDPDSDSPHPGPFDARYRVTPEDAAFSPFFREYYGFPDDPLGDEGASWRRIDDEWLVSGLGRLALQLDVGVNNTSLALVFELPGGRTLIFPGDAQFGNWLSWDGVTFKDPAGHELPVTAKQLLNRAVFYKVGHHGSHNATRLVDLHEMVSGDLVAMIPTDEEFAKLQNPKGSWKMPAPKLHEDLKTFTDGRILRADGSAKSLNAQAGAGAPSQRWSQFLDRVKFADEPLLNGQDPKETPLYVEYRIPLK